MKRLSRLFTVLAVVLSYAMCATVAYNVRDMLCGIAHKGYSAPVWVALLSAVPFVIGIAVCAGLAVWIHNKNRER
jgi:hypothetical protein